MSSLPEKLPELTLGWGVLSFGTTWFNQPNENKNYRAGVPWRYTREQARFILHFYAVTDEGEWFYDRGVLERPKGWGKSPLLAALCATELLGPIQFSHFDRNGQPVGKPRMDALVQIAAISEKQTNNTMTLLPEMLAGKCQANFGLSLMLSQIVAPGGRKIERVTASPRGLEGNRATFAVLDETHLWVPVEKGPELSGVVRRNLAKGNGRSVETTNAPVPGQNSVAEESHDYYEQIQAGLYEEWHMLFDTREVVVEDIYDKEEAFPKLVEVYGDAGDPKTGWIDLKRIWREINDPASKEYDMRRFYFNQRVQTEGQWIKDSEWAKAERDLTLKKDDLIALGFKGVTRNGAAAIVACRLVDGALFLLGHWEKPVTLPAHVDWELPVKTVDAKMRKWLGKQQTRYMVADDWTLQDVVGRWAVDFVDDETEKPVVETCLFTSQLRATRMIDQFEEALRARRIVHEGAPGLTQHVLNCRTEETPHGYNIRKEKPSSNKYITAAQAAVLAFEAAQIAIAKGALDEKPDNGLYGF